MPYSAEVIADSISTHGHRLTTILASYPRFVHSEHLRHRCFSYSVASSRALPVSAMIEQVMTDPVIPVYWGKNQKGMGAKEELATAERGRAESIWLHARDEAVQKVQQLQHLGDWDSEPPIGLSKELSNRLLESWMWVTVLVTGTEWENFFFLRCHPAAQPEMRRAAELMQQAMQESTPTPVPAGAWHLPFIREEDWNDATLIAEEEHAIPAGVQITASDRYEIFSRTVTLLRSVSAGRCARTSYLTHLGVRDLREDIRLHDQLLAGRDASPPQPMHLSPTEHQATPLPEDMYLSKHDAWNLPATHFRHGVEDLQRHWNTYGNLVGWSSYRNTIPGEDGRSADR